MTETNLGDIVQDFHWMMGTDLHLCQQEKAPMGVVTYHTLVLLHIVLLDWLFAGQKQEEVDDI